MKDFQSWLDRKPSGPKPRKRLPKVSKKHARELVIYHRMLPGWLEAHPTCEIGPIIKAAGFSVRCNRITKHPHHVLGLIGKLLYDERYLLASCNGECHPQWVHETHKDEAIKLGLIQ